MDRESRRRLGRYRRDDAGPIENAMVDEWLSGEFDRRELIRRASMFGVGVPVVGALLAATGEVAPAFASQARAAASTSRLRFAIIPAPTGAIEPSTFEDQGGLETGGICGEFLTRTGKSAALLPELATSWKPNGDATVWTFTLRQGVKFHTGQPMTSADVVATWKTLTSPGSQALSAVGSFLAPSGIVAPDDMTVEFHLSTPVSNFPFLVSSDTYQAIILPANYKTGSFTTTPQCTGAFMLTNYNPGVGATYERFSGWWGGTAPLAGVDVTYYSTAAAADAALLGGQVDLIGQVQVTSDRAVLNNSNVQIFKARGATHREVCMRVDVNNPLKHWQVRQAIALTLDRPAIVKQLFNGFADLGNDEPFAPVYGLAKSVPQRKKDIAKAKALMKAAGFEKGFKITLNTETTGEIPALAQIIKQSVKAIGIDMTLSIVSPSQWFAGTASGPPKGWGNTPWLNTDMNITDWGGRPVPNVYLLSVYSTLSKSGAGVWNAAHYSNKTVDADVKKYLAAPTFKQQNKYATTIAEILLHDTPVIIPYFYNYLAAGSKAVKGYYADQQGQVYVSKTSLS